MNSLNQTDLHDWELLPQDEFLDDGGGKLLKQQHQPEPEETESVEIKPSQGSEEINSPITDHPSRVDQDSLFEFGEEKEPCDKSEVDSKGGIKMEESDGSHFNIWKWSLTGMGTICSFGVAAASVCIIILSNHRKNNQNLHFRIYTQEKNHNSSKLDEAISALRGGSIITRARLTFGGYYDAPL